MKCSVCIYTCDSCLNVQRGRSLCGLFTCCAAGVRESGRWTTQYITAAHSLPNMAWRSTDTALEVSVVRSMECVRGGSAQCECSTQDRLRQDNMCSAQSIQPSSILSFLQLQTNHLTQMTCNHSLRIDVSVVQARCPRKCGDCCFRKQQPLASN